ncbi:MAG: KilA-N domain-containing protein [Symploca sp. SIO2G7]|nr:KilA-N domain-containing protein [Symploca sp. SIO2G7]
MAKPFKKRVNNWKRLKSTKALLETFRQDPSYDGMQPFIIKRGREKGSKLDSSDLSHPTLGGGTWAHPDIAIQFAQWCSPGFALWFHPYNLIL